jgi:hypothetical protein
MDVSFVDDDVLFNETAQRAHKELKKVYATMLESKLLKTMAGSRKPIQRLTEITTDFATSNKQDLLGAIGEPVIAHLVARGWVVVNGTVKSIAPDKDEKDDKKSKKKDKKDDDQAEGTAEGTDGKSKKDKKEKDKKEEKDKKKK